MQKYYRKQNRLIRNLFKNQQKQIDLLQQSSKWYDLRHLTEESLSYLNILHLIAMKKVMFSILFDCCFLKNIFVFF